MASGPSLTCVWSQDPHSRRELCQEAAGTLFTSLWHFRNVTRASLERSDSGPPAADRGPSRGHWADSQVPQGSPQFLGGGWGRAPRCYCLTVMMSDVSPDEQCGLGLALCPISAPGKQTHTQQKKKSMKEYVERGVPGWEWEEEWVWIGSRYIG